MDFNDIIEDVLGVIFAVFIGLLVMLIGIGIGESSAEKQMQKKAIESGIGGYNRTNGQFEYIVIDKKVENN
jgi:hypothetical protein